MPEDDRDVDAKRVITQRFSILSNRLWQRLTGLIGIADVTICLRSVLIQTGQQYAFLHMIVVDDTGIHIDPLEAHLEAIETDTLQAGLVRYMDAVVALLSALTGEVLVHKVTPLVQQFKHHLEA